jgi:hypothetical protein
MEKKVINQKFSSKCNKKLNCDEIVNEIKKTLSRQKVNEK